ncbi:MAG: type II toxin-antitoxin system VapC family toxin [Treponema sp.]|nr:type II toxin-antitoxin system VapC family toxin [Treponema sp.]
MAKNIYLLDTNIISEPVRRSPNFNLLSKLKENGDFCCISSITWLESLYGMNTMPEGKTKERIRSYLLNKIHPFLPIIPYDEHCSFLQAEIQAQLKEKGITIPDYDMLIAATALANNLILITHNTKDFQNIPGLMYEDWII